MKRVLTGTKARRLLLPEEHPQTKAEMLIASDAAYARKRVTVQAETGANESLFQTLRTAGKLHVQTELTAEDGAEIRADCSWSQPGENALVYDEVIGALPRQRADLCCGKLTLGHGDVYAQTGIGLDGEDASSAGRTSAIWRRNSQTLDMNLVVNHCGQEDRSAKSTRPAR